jgi:hypothetical protein
MSTSNPREQQKPSRRIEALEQQLEDLLRKPPDR